MSLIKTSNNGGLPAFRSLLSDFFDTDKFFSDDFFRKAALPAVNVIENEKNFELELAAPGMKKDDFKIKVENGLLSISAETKEEKEEKDKNYTRREFSYNAFSRSFTLPENADADDISARYENGVLHLGISKKVPSKPAKKEIVVS